MAACLLAVLAISGGNVRRSISLPQDGSSTSYAVAMLEAAYNSNSSHQVYSMSKVNFLPQISFRPENHVRAGFGYMAMTNK